MNTFLKRATGGRAADLHKAAGNRLPGPALCCPPEVILPEQIQFSRYMASKETQKAGRPAGNRNSCKSQGYVETKQFCTAGTSPG